MAETYEDVSDEEVEEIADQLENAETQSETPIPPLPTAVELAMQQPNTMIHQHFHTNLNPDSIEFGTPGKLGAIKVYGNFMRHG